MHHSNERDPAMEAIFRDMAKQQKLGPTSEFPEGKLTPSDEGEIRLAVGATDGKVVLNLGTPVAWLGMTPQQARQLAESLRQQSYRAEGR